MNRQEIIGIAGMMVTSEGMKNPPPMDLIYGILFFVFLFVTLRAGSDK